MIEVVPPATRDALTRELERVDEEAAAYWRTFPPDAFWRPLEDAWSPADNVRHLLKSTRPVVRALGLPRPVLGLLFGVNWRPSRAYAEIVETYHGRLARGGKAGRFTPAPRPAPADPGAGREELLRQAREVNGQLRAALGRWSERALDRYRLPHPLLGKLTVREMLLFTLYHHVHHVGNVVRRTAQPM